LNVLRVDQPDVLANLPSVIHQMKSVELEPQSAGSPFAVVDIKSNLLSQQLSISIKKSCLHMALEQTRAKHRAEVCDSHIALPQFLRHCSDLNPEVIIALQVDEHDCFMRLFVTIPRLAEVFSKLCLPILHLDGAHSKSTLCDGVLILIVAKLGNGTFVALAKPDDIRK
jgi:hypothetical protein